MRQFSFKCEASSVPNINPLLVVPSSILSLVLALTEATEQAILEDTISALDSHLREKDGRPCELALFEKSKGKKMTQCSVKYSATKPLLKLQFVVVFILKGIIFTITSFHHYYTTFCTIWGMVG